jgi:hypothetical protein
MAANVKIFWDIASCSLVEVVVSEVCNVGGRLFIPVMDLLNVKERKNERKKESTNL